jgi:DNA-binding transcriptional LysR family regulator
MRFAGRPKRTPCLWRTAAVDMGSETDFKIFARVVSCGGLSAAGRELGLSPAMISKRLAQLEAKLGARLLNRTTRQVTLTDVGQHFYEKVEAILAAIEDAESFVTGQAGGARGVLRISAPTSFGRMHLAPHLKAFLDAHPSLSLELNLTDEFIDLVAANVDVAIRIAALADSSLVAQRLAPNRRVLCATPAYLREHGTPNDLDDLRRHRLLAATAQTQWRLEGPEGPETIRVQSFIRTNSSEVVRETVLASLGVAMRSTWDVSQELKSGTLSIVLPHYRGSSDVAIYALHPSRQLVSPNVKAFTQFLMNLYGKNPYWDRSLGLLYG